MAQAQRVRLAQEGLQAIDEFRGSTASELRDLRVGLRELLNTITSDYSDEHHYLDHMESVLWQSSYMAGYNSTDRLYQDLGRWHCGIPLTVTDELLLANDPRTLDDGDSVRYDQLLTDLYVGIRARWVALQAAMVPTPQAAP